MVFCRKYQQSLEGLDKPPMPGAKGQVIFDNVSKKAWLEWQNVQTMLINEKHLRLIEPEARAYLSMQMERFLENEEVDKADGYVAPDQ